MSGQDALDGTDDGIRGRPPERYDLGVPGTVVDKEKKVLVVQAEKMSGHPLP